MRIRRIALSLFVVLACLASTASAATPSKFGRLFPGLPAFGSPTNQQIADLVQTQLDPKAEDDDNDAMASGFTYFGQFIDHDLTLDQLVAPTAPVDPTTLTNSRTFKFDLDSVYGGGPDVSPQLYEADKLHFLVQEDNGNGVRDLPRNPDGSAILIEGRNDENEIIGQMHVAFLKAHNRLVDEGATFAQAKRTLTLNYQWAVVHDYLPHILMKGTGKLVADREEQLRALTDNPTMTPVEFSVSAFRFGHSQVRDEYEINEDTGKIPVFSITEPDLRGGRPIPKGMQIDWANFFGELREPGDDDGINISRRIDTLISEPLFQLPIPGAEAEGSNVLAFRNIQRAGFYSMPSGQDVAGLLDLPVISPAELNLGPGFETGTPLWYYILAESQRVAGGTTLGPVGSIIVGATFQAVLARDNTSIAHLPAFEPDAEIAGEDGKLTISDLLVFAGVAGDDKVGLP